MGIINAECGKTFRIAYQGENKRQQVRFDLADIMGEFPGGTAVLAVLRNGDADPVPAAETAMDGTALIWTVTAWECALEGFLYAQVTYAAGETVAKTKVYRFDVKNSLVVNGAEPEDWQDLVGQLVEAADGVNSAISEAMDTLDEKVTAAETAQSAAEDAQEAAETARDEAVAAVGQYDDMTAEATGLAAGEEPTAVIDHTGDHPVLQLGIPKGEKGDTGATGQAGPAGPSGVDGFSPTAGVSKVGKIATITIVDKNGTTTASVSDGADGDPGDIIDDTAGAGDTDKTFSADKLTTMNSELLNQINVLKPAATASDVGKFLKVKTVADGKPTSFEYGEGGGGSVDPSAIAQAVDAWLDENITNPDSPPLDRSLTSDEAAAPADLLGSIKDEIKSKIYALKTPFVTALQHLTWTDDNGQTYIGDISDAFNAFKLSYITATYTNSSAVSVLDALDTLKPYITVTAYNIDGTTETVSANSYTLSGSLYDGDNTITVTYIDKTATITVEAEEPDVPSGYTTYDYIRRNLALGTGNDGSISIITDFSMGTDYTMDIDIYVPSESNQNYSFPVCGSMRVGYNPVNQFSLWANSKIEKAGYIYHGTTNRSSASGFNSDMPLTKGVAHHIKVRPVGKSKTYSQYATILIDDTEYSTGSSATGTVWSPWLTFFSIGSSASTTYQGGSLYEIGLRIGRVAIRNASNECIHYLIPANDGTHCGLYDAVGEKMYYNADYYENFVCENEAE